MQLNPIELVLSNSNIAEQNNSHTSGSFEPITQEALSVIKRKLIHSAIQHKEGLYWETMGLDANGDVKWESSESMYCGVGGIAWFFLNYHRCFADQEALDMARKAVSWCSWYIRQEKPYSSAFISGRLSLALLFIELNKVLPDKQLEADAILVVQQCTQGPLSNPPIDDFINGTSGKLQALMMLYQELPKPEIVSQIKKYAWQLIDNAWVTKHGIYWDRSGQQICGLCGFSHGVSGFAHVFEQLATFFNEPAWLFVMKQAFAYEDHYFQKTVGNWPDLRRGAYTADELEKHKHEFKQNNKDFFERFNDMNAWCHGAAGIGLARLHAWKNTGIEGLKKSGLRAVRKTVETELTDPSRRYNFTLCHGGGGNSDLFIEAYHTFNKNNYLNHARKVADAAMESFEKQGYYTSGYNQASGVEDTSLFMGLAGVGYFYLRTLFPNRVPSVLLPRIKNNTGVQISSGQVNPGEIKKRLLARYYPKTVTLLPLNFFDAIGDKLISDFTAAVRKFLVSHPNRALKSVFTYESRLMNFDLKAPSHSWLSVKRTLQAMQEEVKIDLDVYYQLDEDTLLIKFQGDFQVVTRNSAGNHVESIPNFAFGILEQLKKPKLVPELVHEVCLLFGELNEEEQAEVKAAVINQLSEALRSGLVTAVGG